MKAPRLRVISTVLVLLALILTACGGQSPAPSAAPAKAPEAAKPAEAAKAATPAPAAPAPAAPATPPPAAAKPAEPPKPLEKVKFAISAATNSFFPVRVGDVKGFFKEEGFDPEIQTITGTVSVQALNAKQIDFNGSWGSTMRGALAGLPLKGVVMTWRRTFNKAIVRPELKKPEDFKGKVYAISGSGGTADVTCRALLESKGVKMADMQVVNFTDDPEIIQALVAGRGHATCLAPPHSFKALELGMQQFGDLSDVMQLPNFGGLAVHMDSISQKPDQVKRMVRAHLRALQFIKANKAETLKIMIDWMKISEKDANLNWDMIQAGMAFDGYPAKGGLEALIDLELKNLKQPGPVAWTKVADFSLLKQAITELKISRDANSHTYE